MKRHLLLWAVAALLVAGGGRAWALNLVANGEPQAAILTADEPSETVRLAVEELNYWVERITGARLPVVQHGAWDGRSPVVAVGPSPFMEERGVDVSALGPEGARVVVADNFVALLGRDDAPLDGISWRGTYYAVMELVKRSFGVRFVWPGELGEVFEPRATLAVETGEWTWETPLVVARRLRNVYSERGLARVEEQLPAIGMEVPREAWDRHTEDTERWLLRHRMNIPSTVRFGHSFTTWWGRYGEEHPDWFAHPPAGRRRPGGRGQKLCVSNPELRQRVFEEWHEAWQEDPAANKALRACPNDSRNFCVCPNCREWDGPDQAHFSDMDVYARPDPRVTDRYVRFWNDLAERVVAVDPEAVVTGYAYRSYRRPPMHNKIHPSVVIGYVGGEGFYPLEDYLREEWQQWADAGAQMHWRPNLLHCGHSAPYLFARQLGADFKHFHNNRMIGTDFDSLMGAWATQGPNYYVLAELHARPDAEPDELLREYSAAFGTASDEVMAYFDYWEQVTLRGPDMLEELLRPARLTWGQWTPGFIRLLPMLYTEEVLAEGDALLKQAEAKVALDAFRRIRWTSGPGAGNWRAVPISEMDETARARLAHTLSRGRVLVEIGHAAPSATPRPTLTRAHQTAEIARARVAFLRIGFDHTRLTAAALREAQLLQANDPAGDIERLRQARAALREFREQHAESIAIPVFHATFRELRYRDTSPVWLLGE